MRAAEEAAFERLRASAGSKPRESHRVAQAAEMRNLLQKNHSLRVTVRREREAALAVLKQKYRNLEADLSHSHKIEWSLRAEVCDLPRSPYLHASEIEWSLRAEVSGVHR
jgi:hypothetical protein